MDYPSHPKMPSSITVRSGLQPISKSLEKKDIQSLQKWLERAGKSTPNTNIYQEKKMASNPNYLDKPGYGTLFYVAPENKKHPQGPDFTGHLVLDMDYKAGERINFGLWQKETKQGTTMFSVREDNWLKKKKLEEQQPREVTPGYAKKPNTFNRSRDDNDVPF
jgi:hypothetical protein